ncbi:MAG TPA: Uma2 family endonuclease [Alphaproteobacteria bacterium]|nr:Uma2 family endonuclease [Alphaproteobacteria bacterium]
MATTEKLLTAEEFEALPDDGKRYELIDGELREMAPLTMWHGEVEANLATLLGRHVCAHGLGRVSCGAVLFIVRRNPDRVRAADIAFIRQERVPPLEARQHIMEVIPDLVVEILSKSETIKEVNDRIDDWLGAGVQMLWIVDPFRRTVTIFRPEHDPTLVGEHGILEGDPVISGFRCPVAELFA